MKRLLLLAALGVVLAVPGQALAANLTVNNGGPCSDATGTPAYCTIQAAVNAASPNDTISVSAGIYNEAVTVSKTLTLKGAQAGVDARTRAGTETVVDNTNTGFYVSASNVVIDGFTVQGDTNPNQFGAGVLLGAGVSGTQFLNNVVQNNIVGLFLANTGTSQALIQHNVFRNNNTPGPSSGTGIYTDQFTGGGTVSNVVIKQNTFAGNADAGIDFSSTDATKPATGIAIDGNLFDANARGLVAFVLTSSTIVANTFQNSTDAGSADIRLFEGGNGLTIFQNVLKNGAGRAFRVSNAGTGPADATGVSLNRNSITGYATAFNVQVDNYNGTLDATCNWWGSATGPTAASNPGGTGSSIGGTGAFDFDPWLISSDLEGACPAGPQDVKQAVRASLQSQLPSGNKDTDKRLNDAIDHIDKSLDPKLWADATHPDPKKGDKVFNEEKEAVKALMGIKNPSATVTTAISQLVAIDRGIAANAIAEAAGGDAKKLADANKELAKGDDEASKGHFDGSIDHYKNAWKKALEA